MKAPLTDPVVVLTVPGYPQALAAARCLEAAGILCQVDSPPALCMNLWHGQDSAGISVRVPADKWAAARALLRHDPDGRLSPAPETALRSACQRKSMDRPTMGISPLFRRLLAEI